MARPYASFMSIECPELINKVVGESERAVTRLFQAARQAAPCILFLDHIEVSSHPSYYVPIKSIIP